MKIAITGATGFLGKYLVEYFISKEYNVKILARPVERASEIFTGDVEIYECNYTTEELNEAFQTIDVVIHLAAQTLQRESDPLRVSGFYSGNIKLTEDVLVAAKESNVRSVIQMSSNGVYSNANQLPFIETQNPVPANIYGVSKLMAENLGEYISYKTNLKVASLRLARLFGYGERDSVVFTKYMKLALKKKPVEVFGEGKTAIDYIYVRDVVQAIDAAIMKNIPAGIYNVGSGLSYSIKQIAETVCKVCDNTENLVFDSKKPEGGYFIEMNSDKFYNATGWKPKWELEKAVKEMCKLYDNMK